ncbi:MAG: DUF1552 domain-containing protein [Polyangiaceae bacterium]|jgi:hypothetical protein
MQRRQFLRGIGGVTLGLPLLDAFIPRWAKANPAAVRSPYVAVVVHANGVVQAGSAIGGSTDPEWFWPSAAGPLTVASLTTDSGAPDPQDGGQPASGGREIGELAAYATQLLVVRGVNHAHPAAGCQHAGGDAQILTGNSITGSGPATLSAGPSIDTVIAQKMNAGGNLDPLALHAGRYSPGGMGFNVPGYISYVGPSQPRSPTPSPYQAYLQMIGNGSSANVDAGAQALIASRRKSVNDLVRGEMQALLARTDLSASDVTRLEQHFAAIRDIEVGVTATLDAATVASMQAVDPAPYDMTNHLEIIQLHMDLMVFALSSDYTRAITLKIGDREDDHEFTQDGGTTFHLISHRGVADAVQKHDRIVRTHLQIFRGFLDALQAVSTPSGTLLDLGLPIWTNQIANGAHSYTRIPWVIVNAANSYLRTGQFVDLPGTGATTNQMLNTLLTAAGVPTTTFGDATLAPGVISQILA